VRVLVTGHQGYIGSILVPLLLDAKHEVVGLDSGLFRDCVFSKDSQSILAMRKDIRDITSDDLFNVQAVVHLAGMSFSGDDLDPRLIYDINYNGTLQLASLAKFAGVRRFISLSSYDGSPVPTHIRSGNDLFLKAPELGDRYIGRFLEEDIGLLAASEFAPTFLRCNSVYGFSPRMRLDLTLNQIVASVVTTGEAYIPSDGESFHPGSHVQDVAEAILAVLQAPQTVVMRKALDIGNIGGALPNESLAALLKQAMPGCNVVFVEAAEWRANYRPSQQGYTEGIPYFSPRWNVEQGISQLIEALSAYRVPDDFRSERFHRRNYIRYLIREGAVDASLRWFESPERRPSYMNGYGNPSTSATSPLVF
jgi:nucleoside-diphosphate-sugar epimerase